ncbi:PREDICTED: protein CREG1 [Ceratosolen solmsi marchali]|uniref:Protein CREG1 n=1 Tax=Ceratosolen solmsi marchali TaxID=326594 RepID=A0AAJ6YJZ8_9HYME|nr:PREDICTED: protein CREG1 [Ceratosolen solmsi marchali]
MELALRLALVMLLLVTLAKASYVDLQEFRDFQEFRAWKRLNGERKDVPYWRRRDELRLQDPPPIDEVALMARYIVNQADWTSVSTISSRKNTKGYPFVNIVSLSDGPVGNGTGIPYIFLTPLDFTAQDVFKDNRATLMMTLAQGHYCQEKNYDPMDPRCSRVVFSGKIKSVRDDNPEFQTAKSAIFGRHPWLAHMPEDHHFFFAKLKIETIAVLDTFGGPKYISLNEYLHPNTVALTDYFIRHSSHGSEFNNRILQHPIAIKV